jgi:hypothetical protein
MAKESANKDKYHPSNGVLEPHVQMPRAKASVRTVLAWESERLQEVLLTELHRSNRCATPVRPVRVWTGRTLGFVLIQMIGLVLEVVVLVVGLESLQVVSLLGVLPLVLNTGMGGVLALSWRGEMVHGFPFVVLVLL